MFIDSKTWLHRLFSCISCYLRPINVQLTTPHQSSFLALLHHLLLQSDERSPDHSGYGYGSDCNDRARVPEGSYPKNQRMLSRSAPWRISCRSERIPSKNSTSCSG